MGDNGIGLAEALVGLEGFRVLDVAECDGEVMVRIETIAELEPVRGAVGGPSRRTGWSVKGRLVLSRGKALGVDPAVRWDRIPNIDILQTLFAELKQSYPAL